MTNKTNLSPMGQESVTPGDKNQMADMMNKKKVRLSKASYEKLKLIAALKGDDETSLGAVLDGILDDYFDGRNDTISAIKAERKKAAVHLSKENVMLLKSIAVKEKDGKTVGSILNSIIEEHFEQNPALGD